VGKMDIPLSSCIDKMVIMGGEKNELGRQAFGWGGFLASKKKTP